MAAVVANHWYHWIHVAPSVGAIENSVCSPGGSTSAAISRRLETPQNVMADHANFQWPWQYNFPPFFTIQPNLDTRKKQLEAWRSLILNYHRAKKLYILDVTESHSSPLFCNKAINRKLNLDSVLLVLEDLRQKGNLEWLDKQRKCCYIYWRTPEEWAKHIYRYVSDNGMVNTVCTLYELKNGEDTLNQEFHGIDDGILVRALRNLEMDKKAELISFEGNEGVKFF